MAANNEQTLRWDVEAALGAAISGAYNYVSPRLGVVRASAGMSLTENMGSAVTMTLAAATETYAELGKQFLASELVELHEDKVQRRSVRQTAAYGNVNEYQRVLACAEGNLTTSYAGVLALGTTMPSFWRDTGMGTGVGVDSARLQSVSVAEPMPSGGKRRIVLTYTAVEALSTTQSYRETVRTPPRRKDAFTDVYETWGIAASAASVGVPDEGDYLSGYSKTTYAPMCIQVDIDTTSQQGRVIVHALWEAARDSWLEEIEA